MKRAMAFTVGAVAFPRIKRGAQWTWGKVAEVKQGHRDHTERIGGLKKLSKIQQSEAKGDGVPGRGNSIMRPSSMITECSENKR